MEKLNDLANKTVMELITPWNFRFKRDQPFALGHLDSRGYLAVDCHLRAAAYIKSDENWIIQFRSRFNRNEPIVIETKDTNMAEYAFNMANDFSEEYCTLYKHPGFLHYLLRCWRRKIDWELSNEQYEAKYEIPYGHTKIREFESISHPGTKHLVISDNRNNLYCTCTGFGIYHTCSHIDRVKKEKV